MHRLITSAGLSVVVGLGLVPGAKAQEIATASYERGPRFLLAMETKVVRIDVNKTPVLARRLNLELEGATLKQALAEITTQSGLVLAYSDDAVPLAKRVHLRAEAITAAAALTDVLFDAGVDVVFKADGSAALVRRPPAPQNGSVSGRVTDAKTSAAIAGATVVIERSSRSTTTDNDGHYRIAEVTPGTYTVRARYIGYAPGTTSVTVSADQDASADFALEKSVQRLDEVVTTGTVVPTEVKALPTPVSIITASDIELQRPPNVQELVRQAVPTAVSWNLASTPDQTPFSVRGASSVDVGGAQIKVFVDGLEVADPTRSAIDPTSIERVEVIRGPQASAIYGADAIGGVVQIFTKRGDSRLARPQLDAQVGLGIAQTPYTGFNGVLRQNYSGSVHGGGPDVTYNLGAAHSRTGDYIPSGEQSAQARTNVFGGMRFARGITTVDISGRVSVYNFGNVVNPELAQTGFVFWSKPRYLPTHDQYQSIGARITLAPLSWWNNVVTVGVDRLSFEFAQSQPRLTTPADTLLMVFNSSAAKTSIAVGSSVHGALGGRWAGSLTAGVDHYWFPTSQFFAFRVRNTTGSLALGPGGFISASRTSTNNTGYFAQGQLGFRNVVFLTAGLRAEENTNLGDSLGTPVSPRVGLSYAPQVGAVTLKLRGSWGRAIRPPTSGFKLFSSSGTTTQLGNPGLGPERQKGWDAGADVAFGSRGSLSVTYFNQIAENLIQAVNLATTPGPTYQYQNIGRVRNTGVEVEGRLSAGPVQLSGQYGYVRARLDQLSPSYTGEQRVGDQIETIPRHTAGVSASVNPFGGTTILGGVTYVGSFTSLDLLGYYRCLGGTGPCQNTTAELDRGYLIKYPGFARVRVSVDQRITPQVSGFASVDNLTNNESHELLNNQPIVGRVTTVGARLRW